MNWKMKVVSLVAIAALGFAMASPADASGASKQVLFDHALGSCTSGLITGTPTSSFTVMNIARTQINATVSLKGLAPNTTYHVDVVQVPSGESCFQLNPGEASVTTNGQGYGAVAYREPILPGQIGVFVMLITFGDTLATPTVSF